MVNVKYFTMVNVKYFIRFDLAQCRANPLMLAEPTMP